MYCVMAVLNQCPDVSLACSMIQTVMNELCTLNIGKTSSRITRAFLTRIHSLTKWQAPPINLVLHTWKKFCAFLCSFRLDFPDGNLATAYLRSSSLLISKANINLILHPWSKTKSRPFASSSTSLLGHLGLHLWLKLHLNISRKHLDVTFVLSLMSSPAQSQRLTTTLHGYTLPSLMYQDSWGIMTHLSVCY